MKKSFVIIAATAVIVACLTLMCVGLAAQNPTAEKVSPTAPAYVAAQPTARPVVAAATPTIATSRNWVALNKSEPDGARWKGIGTWTIRPVHVGATTYEPELMVLCQDGKTLGIGMYTQGLMSQPDKAALSFLDSNTIYPTNAPSSLGNSESVVWLEPFADVSTIFSIMETHDTMLVAAYDQNGEVYTTAFDISGFKDAVREVYAECGK